MAIDDLCKRLYANETFLSEFTQKAVAWGITIVPKPANPIDVQVIRATLFPKTFPLSLYEKMIEVNPIFNRLIDAICLDLDWLVHAHHGMYSPIFIQFLCRSREM